MTIPRGSAAIPTNDKQASHRGVETIQKSVWAWIIRTRIDLDGEKVATLGVSPLDGGVTKLPALGQSHLVAIVVVVMTTTSFITPRPQRRLTFSIAPK
jgi:hypothetical protein